jgi:3alpha(or 20beta)-hydroxysteroid dehydrogenase
MGLAHAEVLASEGAKVLLTDVLDEMGSEQCERMKSKGLEVEYAHLDVTSEADWAGVVEAAQTAFGGANGLVNNAGIAPQADIYQETRKGWELAIAVNATGPLLGIQALAPGMRDEGGGSIVNIASVAGLRGSPSYLAYCASKAALISLTKTTALALAVDGIRVNAICPGSIETPMTADGPKRVVERTPLGRRGEAHEVAQAVLFLISPRSSYVTGAELVVDGGFLTV